VALRPWPQSQCLNVLCVFIVFTCSVSSSVSHVAVCVSDVFNLTPRSRVQGAAQGHRVVMCGLLVTLVSCSFAFIGWLGRAGHSSGEQGKAGRGRAGQAGKEPAGKGR
jgi:hypothetical protein